MTENTRDAIKVPAVTLGFWVVKIAATTVGETGGDWVTMSLNLGYALGAAILATVFAVAVAIEISARGFRPYLYWSVVVATTTLGTTLADLCDRSLGAGYLSGVVVLFLLLMLSLGVWYSQTGAVAVETVATPRVEGFYWVTILLSQTLGTALGDFTADDDLHGLGLGYEWSALIFSSGLAIVAGAYLWSRLSRAGLFWAAFILTRPLGATLGDLLDKPLSMGGLNVSRLYATGALVLFIIVSITALPQKAAQAPTRSRRP